MNDYELVYLIRHEHDHVALEFLMRKYHRFIWKQVHLLGVDAREFDDFHQEGLMMLIKAVKTFNESRGKTFTRYFELILKRQFYHLKRSLPKHQLYENPDFYKGTVHLEEAPLNDPGLNEKEKIVYQAYFIEKQAIANIALQMKQNNKHIYNMIYRIREKYKKMI